MAGRHPLFADVAAALGGTPILQEQFAATFFTPFPNATQRTFGDVFAETVNVKFFGALGDGQTNDTAAFVAAIATGRTVTIPAGIFIVSPLIIAQSLRGAGRDVTTLRVLPGTAPGLALITQNAALSASVTGITIDGGNICLYGIVMPQGNTQQTALRFEQNEFKNIGAFNATAAALPVGIFCPCDPARLTSKQGIIVTDNYFHDIYGNGVLMNGTGCAVQNNVVNNVGSAGISSTTMINGVITGNTISKAGTLAAIAADGITGYDSTNKRVLVADNTIDGSANHGIHMGGSNIQINDNKVYNVNGYSILLQSSPNSTPTPSANGTIEGNECDTTISGGGIRCGWFSRVNVSGNTVSNTALHALTLLLSSDCIVTDNIVFNVTGGNGLYLDTAINALVTDNRFMTTSGKAINDTGGSTGAVFGDNLISGEGVPSNVNRVLAALGTGNVQISAAALALGLTSAFGTISSGTGAPSSTQPAGSLFMRTDGAAGARLYVSAGSGTWAAVPGV